MKRIKVMQHDQTFLMNLADVPHGDLIGSKDFEDGRHIDFYEALPGTKVIAYDEKTGQPKWVDVSGWSRHTGSKVELVQLSNGDTITTDNDPRAVYGIPIDSVDFQLDRDTPANAKKRCFVIPVVPALPEDTPVFTSINILEGGTPSCLTPIPKNGIFAADYDFGQFLGLIAGDGWWNKKTYGHFFDGQICLSDLEGYNASFFISFGNTHFSNFRYSKHEYKKDDHPDRYGDTVRWVFNCGEDIELSKALSNMLGGHGDDKTTGSANKRLPFWFLSMPREFRIGLLSGLIATDGSISLNSSGARKHPELMISFSSTSIQLIEDVKALCASLGVKSSIYFAKKTVWNNDSWGLSLCSVDCKREGLFNNCCHTRKRDIFLSADVDDSPNSLKGEIVPLTRQSVKALKKYIATRPSIEKPVIGTCFLSEFTKLGNSLYSSLHQYKDRGYITRDFSSRFCKYCNEKLRLLIWFNDYVRSFRDRLEKGERVFAKEEVNTLVEGIAFNADFFPKDLVLEARAKAGQLRQKGTSFPCTLKDLLTKLILGPHTMLFQPEVDDPVVRQWIILSSMPVKWAYIEKVEKTNQTEEGYDLTVPGYETFASAGGVILSNTMTYYVPVSQKAVDEAYRLMTPSKNQLAARDFKALPELQEELVSGTFFSSRRKNDPPKAVFNTYEEAKAAYRAGKIKVDDNIIIKELQ